MATMSGARAVGTDGRDFTHREKVAAVYQISALYKWRVKVCIFFHLQLAGLLALKLVEELLDVLHVDLPYGLDELMDRQIPKPHWWEYAWLATTPAAFAGLLALPRNRVLPMQGYVYGTAVFGLVPITLGLISLLPEFYTYVFTHQAEHRFLGLPLVVIWYMFFAVALQVHIFGMYFGWELQKAWSKRLAQKKKAF